jgi:hypothetical protein
MPDREVLTLPLPFHTFQSPVLTTTGAIVVLAVVQFLIYAFSSALSTLRNITQQLLQERVTLTIQLLVMDHAARLDLPFFEESSSYDLLRRAQTDAANRPVAMISPAWWPCWWASARCWPWWRWFRRCQPSSTTPDTGGGDTTSPAGLRRCAAGCSI